LQRAMSTKRGRKNQIRSPVYKSPISTLCVRFLVFTGLQVPDFYVMRTFPCFDFDFCKTGGVFDFLFSKVKKMKFQYAFDNFVISYVYNTCSLLSIILMVHTCCLLSIEGATDSTSIEGATDSTCDGSVINLRSDGSVINLRSDGWRMR